MPNLFQEVKSAVSIIQAAEFVGLKNPEIEAGKDGTKQYRYPCPKCKSPDPRALSINDTINKFRCWSCDAGGKDQIQLVAWVLNVRQGEAARMMRDHFISATRPPISTERRPQAGADAKGRGGSVADALAPLVPYNLVPGHEISIQLGMTEMLMIASGGGYAATGEMEGRFLIPIRAEDGFLLAYLCIATETSLEPIILVTPGADERARKWIEAQAMRHIEPPPELPKQAPDTLRKLFRLVRGA